MVDATRRRVGENKIRHFLSATGAFLLALLQLEVFAINMFTLPDMRLSHCAHSAKKLSPITVGPSVHWPSTRGTICPDADHFLRFRAERA